MLLLAGLGNPGPKYEQHRHNIGFMAVDEIARAYRFGPWKSKFQALVCEGELPKAPSSAQGAAPGSAQGAARTLLIKPQTFMNESGRAIGEAARFYKIPLRDIVVFYDEIDLAPGRFRMKTGGGAAGHNGVRSMIAHLGDGFRRARLGVGHPGDKDLVHAHVLSDFAKADRIWLEALLRACAEAVELLVAQEDEKYQGRVMMLAPAPKADPRAHSKKAESE